MATLTDLIKQKQTLTESAEREVPVGTPNAVAIMGVIRRAQIDLEQNKTDYVNESKNQAVFVVATGAEAEEFAKISASEFGCFVVDGEELYKEVSSKVDKAYLGQSLSQGVLNIMQARLEVLSYDIGIVEMPGMVLRQEDVVKMKTREDVDNLAKFMINKHIGVEVNSLYMAQRAGEMAYEADFKGKVMPVVIIAKDEELAKALSEGSGRVVSNSFLVVAGESSLKSKMSVKEVKSEEVEKIFVAIKKGIK